MLTDIYLHITQQGIRPDVVKLTIKNSITHHPGERLGGRSQLRGVEGDLAVSHIDWELLETGQQVLILIEDGTEALLLRPLGYLTHKLEQAFACGSYDKVLVLQAPLDLQTADWSRFAILLHRVDLHQDVINYIKRKK